MGISDRVIQIIQDVDNDYGSAGTPREAEERWVLLLHVFIEFFKVDPRFDQQRFITACVEARNG